MDIEVRRVVNDMKDVIQKEETEMAEKTGIETPWQPMRWKEYMKVVLDEASKARINKSVCPLLSKC